MMPIRMTGTETWDKTWDTRTKVTSRGGAHLKIPAQDQLMNLIIEILMQQLILHEVDNTFTMKTYRSKKHLNICDQSTIYIMSRCS